MQVHIQKANPNLHIEAIKEIFFLCSSRKKFETTAEKESFFNRWTDYYLQNCPDEILVATNDEGIITGYLMGCFDSLKAEAEISRNIPAYSVFSDLFKEYPCHFHINCHPKFQGMGIGTKMLQNYCQAQDQGIHLVTSSDANNIDFYKRHGFNYLVTRRWKAMELLFMGKKF